MSNSNSILQPFWKMLSNQLRGAKPATPLRTRSVKMVPDNLDEAVANLSPRVLVVVFDPILDRRTGQRLLQSPLTAHWQRVDDLLAGYIADIHECSGGLIKHRVVERLTLDYFPVKEDGFTYDTASYRQALQTGRYHQPDWVDYHHILNALKVSQRVASHEIDEVWLFGGPGFGFYESRMAGPGAFWCNSPELPQSEAGGRRFVIMGFNYERGIGEMLEDLGHRAESVLAYRWRHIPVQMNLWQKYSRYDQIAPGQAEVGVMHWAPNSVRDYDWGNPRSVLTRADDWLNFPHLTDQPKMMNCSAWGNGDIRAHHKWWFQHLPKVQGRINGVANNWWRYLIDVADPELDPNAN